MFPANSIGNGLNVVKVMPESAIKFGTYEVSPASFPDVPNRFTNISEEL